MRLFKTATTIAAVCLAVSGCKTTSGTGPNGSNNGSTGSNAGNGHSLFAKYGGEKTVNKLVDDTIAKELADCEVAPYFKHVIGTTGHDSMDKLKSCLRLQLTAMLGGPANYPGKTPDGFTCEDTSSSHQELGIPPEVFDKFMMNVGMVLQADGVSEEDLHKIAPVLLSLKPRVVSTGNTTQYHECNTN